MKSPQFISSRRIGLTLILVVAASRHVLADDVERTTFELSPGIVVDVSNGSAFVLGSDNKVASLDLQTGETRWQATSEGRPIGISNQFLITQAIRAKEASNLDLVLLGAKDGVAQKQIIVPLPLDVALASETKVLRLDRRDAHPALTWQNTSRRLGGAPLGGADAYLGRKGTKAHGLKGQTQRQSDAVPSADSQRGRATFGAFSLDLNAGHATPLSQVQARALIDKERHIANTNDPSRFPSSDGAYYVISRQLTTATSSYEWTVYASKDDRLVGKISVLAHIYPYFVYENQLVYDKPETRRATESGSVTSPRTLVSIDLKNGALIWSRQIKDMQPKGASPP